MLQVANTKVRRIREATRCDSVAQFGREVQIAAKAVKLCCGRIGARSCMRVGVCV